MPLNPDEVKRVRAGMPAETASLTDDQVATAAADTLIAQAQSIRNQNAAAEQARQALAAKDGQIAALQAKVPQPVDPQLAAGHINLALGKLDLLSGQGCLVGDALGKLKADLMPDGKPNLAAVAPGGKVTLSLDAVHDAIALNKPLVKTGEQAPGQREGRVVPGAETQEDEKAALKYAQERAARLNGEPVKTS